VAPHHPPSTPPHLLGKVSGDKGWIPSALQPPTPAASVLLALARAPFLAEGNTRSWALVPGQVMTAHQSGVLGPRMLVSPRGGHNTLLTSLSCTVNGLWCLQMLWAMSSGLGPA
jgi:hypothetical protein